MLLSNPNQLCYTRRGPFMLQSHLLGLVHKVLISKCYTRFWSENWCGLGTLGRLPILALL